MMDIVDWEAGSGTASYPRISSPGWPMAIIEPPFMTPFRVEPGLVRGKARTSLAVG